MQIMRVSRRANCDRYYLLKLFGFGLFIHHLHTPEDKGVYHSHPWHGISLILGSYYEEKMGQPIRLRRWFNFVRANTHHRLELIRPVWTLFFHFRRCNEWEVIDTNKATIKKELWRDLGSPEIIAYT